jgi:hypothetical protein
METSNEGISRTLPGMAFLVKYLFASIAVVPAILSARGIFAYPARLVFVVPLGLWGVFCLTAAEVRADEHVLTYRRFLSWRQIPYEQIVECKNSWYPWFGYLKLTRSVPPWGKIYFVTLRPAFSGNPKELAVFINSRRAGIALRPPEGGSLASKNTGASPAFYILFGFVGVIVSLLYAYLTPEFDQQLRLESNTHGVAALYLKFLYDAVNWPWALGTIAVIIAAMLKFRSNNSVWILALAAGTILGNILARMFHQNPLVR